MEPRQARHRQAAYALIALVAGAVVVGLVTVILQTFEITSTIRESQKQRVSTFDLLVDCTQPEGKCYMDGQKRTAAAVGDINQVVLYAAVCADRAGAQTVEEIQSCVISRLGATK